MQHLKIIASAVLFIFLTACQSNNDEATADVTLSESIPVDEYAPPTIAANEELAESFSGFNAAIPDRMLIKNGELEFETSDMSITYQSLVNYTKENKGYIVQDKIYDYAYRKEHHLTLKVPANSFDNLFQKIADNAQKINRREVNIQDVTEEFTDVATRINNKKALEKRYNDLLSKAHKIEEILQIEKEINEIRTDIETLEGRKNYLKNNISYSTINVRFYTKYNVTAEGDSHFVNAIKKGWKSISSFTWFVISLWPYFILFVLLVIIIKRRKKKLS